MRIWVANPQPSKATHTKNQSIFHVPVPSRLSLSRRARAHPAPGRVHCNGVPGWQVHRRDVVGLSRLPVQDQVQDASGDRMLSGAQWASVSLHGLPGACHRLERHFCPRGTGAMESQPMPFMHGGSLFRRQTDLWPKEVRNCFLYRTVFSRWPITYQHGPDQDVLVAVW